MIAQATLCWKIDWDDLERNQQMFKALCHALVEKVRLHPWQIKCRHVILYHIVLKPGIVHESTVTHPRMVILGVFKLKWAAWHQICICPWIATVKKWIRGYTPSLLSACKTLLQTVTSKTASWLHLTAALCFIYSRDCIF